MSSLAQLHEAIRCEHPEFIHYLPSYHSFKLKTASQSPTGWPEISIGTQKHHEGDFEVYASLVGSKTQHVTMKNVTYESLHFINLHAPFQILFDALNSGSFRSSFVALVRYLFLAAGEVCRVIAGRRFQEDLKTTLILLSQLRSTNAVNQRAKSDRIPNALADHTANANEDVGNTTTNDPGNSGKRKHDTTETSTNFRDAKHLPMRNKRNKRDIVALQLLLAESRQQNSVEAELQMEVAAQALEMNTLKSTLKELQNNYDQKCSDCENLRAAREETDRLYELNDKRIKELEKQVEDEKTERAIVEKTLDKFFEVQAALAARFNR